MPLDAQQVADLVEMIKTEFVELIERISKQHGDKPVIIFFDDLDRCREERALEMLEAVNLFLDYHKMNSQIKV